MTLLGLGYKQVVLSVDIHPASLFTTEFPFLNLFFHRYEYLWDRYLCTMFVSGAPKRPEVDTESSSTRGTDSCELHAGN